MMSWTGEMGTASWVLMSIAWVTLIAAVVWAVAALSSRAARPGTAPIAERPEEILDRRLARGERPTKESIGAAADSSAHARADH